MPSKDSQLHKTYSVAKPSREWRIMVVDDEPDITSAFKMGLERSGFQVDAYNNPQQALAEFRPGKYDLLLLDIRMPGMNGFELYQEMKNMDANIKTVFSLHLRHTAGSSPRYWTK